MRSFTIACQPPERLISVEAETQEDAIEAFKKHFPCGAPYIYTIKDHGEMCD